MFLINISYPANHRKGDGTIIGSEDHANWLLEQIEWLTACEKMPISVSMTGWKPESLSHSERKIFERVSSLANINGIPEDVGLSIGCSYGIRFGLDEAKRQGIKYMFHTAEDVLHPNGSCTDLINRLIQSDANYAGRLHDAHVFDSALYTKFFGCRVDAMESLQADGWYEPGSTDTGWANLNKCTNIELYVGKVIGGVKLQNVESPYLHTHDYQLWRTELEKLKFPINNLLSIQQIGLRCGTSKIGAHSYGPVFDKIIGPLRDKPISICEIGIHTGDSLRMWLDAFPLAHVHGIDTTNFLRFSGNRVHTYNCHTQDKRLATLFPVSSLDVIVDDASHDFDQQHKAFNDLWPALKSGGFYFVEDVRYPSYLESWQGKPGYQVFGRDIHGRGVDHHEDDILIVLQKP